MFAYHAMLSVIGQPNPKKRDDIHNHDLPRQAPRSRRIGEKQAGETVVVWWVFDQELWVEHGEERFGPYHPVGCPISLYRYRKHRKSRR
jgi:hypothetical protein